MRLTWFATTFLPRIGGLETIVDTLSRSFAESGHAVTVITQTPHESPDDAPYTILRQPGWLAQIHLLRESDVFIHANVSLWGVLIWLLCGPRRPLWVATHHAWYCHLDQPRGLLDRLKLALARLWAVNISVSHALDRELELHGHVIPNAYRDDLFRHLPDVPQSRDLVFLGRLVSDKGADLLLDALALLQSRGMRPHLTLIGTGPERSALEDQCVRLQLQNQVRFTGPLSGDALVHELNAHRLLVVPSRWPEPFGIVALEGIACGCAIIGSSGGGLPEAIGPCGMTFPNGDVPALAEALYSALRQPNPDWTEPTQVTAHLRKHQAEDVAKTYHQVIRAAILPHS